MKHWFFLVLLGCLLLAIFSGCGLYNQVILNAQAHPITLSNCPNPPPSSTVTSTLSQSATHFLYFGSAGNLYALNAGSGAMLWCKQVKISGIFSCSGSCPPPPSMLFGQPAVVAGVVYVCVSGYQSYTYAFRANDGSLLWQVESNCAVIPYIVIISSLDYEKTFHRNRALTQYQDLLQTASERIFYHLLIHMERLFMRLAKRL